MCIAPRSILLLASTPPGVAMPSIPTHGVVSGMRGRTGLRSVPLRDDSALIRERRTLGSPIIVVTVTAAA